MQSTLVGLLPGVGSVLSVLHMAMLYALYTFEYKWINEGQCVSVCTDGACMGHGNQ